VPVLQDIQVKYERLKNDFKTSAKSDVITEQIESLYITTKDFITMLTRLELHSSVQGKNYFAFQYNGKRSRAVNTDLFDLAFAESAERFDDTAEPRKVIDTFWFHLRNNTISSMSAHDITCAVYAVAICFCGSIDLLKSSDQKTPGTYFEILIGHLLSKQFDIEPRKQMDILNLGLRTTLPTDFIFDLGTEQPKYHVPVKTSTRERVVQVWSHQRILDGVYGTGRFLGLLTCLAETKVDSQSLDVVEICLPDQWRLYQLFIAQLKRIYYLGSAEKGRIVLQTKEFYDFPNKTRHNSRN